MEHVYHDLLDDRHWTDEMIADHIETVNKELMTDLMPRAEASTK